ncbi:efflux RND transporter periplasmic adaptor subunit [Magnetospirillum sp. SS-4]|uniref:efflux RND transporter periplasmic adaptor subunit n=1 Tax=Magnetospirillum sp. SS-4 TaxID=2681465 RepID=UPI0013801057|nr:efflux RND transporter periplasmic adaptor subunit [Magnetospirillum sp. SS-4]CAA7622109.1 Membrane-fusion protein [Magnetospirillum sp. SS-4]
MTMIQMKRIRSGLAAALLAVALPSAVLAHGGEDHGAPAAATPVVTEQSGFGAEGTAFQAVLYPAAGKTVLYLADADTNAPVTGATIDAEVGGWQGRARPTREVGVYELDWAAPESGTDVTLIVSAAGKDDLILIEAAGRKAAARPVAATPAMGSNLKAVGAAGGAGVVLLAGGLALIRRNRKAAVAVLALGLLGLADPAHAHGGEDHGDAPAAPPQAQPGTPVAMSKPTQFLLGIRTVKVEPQQAADSVRVVGRVIPDPSGYARVQPSQPARVVSDPAHPIPVPGQEVKRGQVLAVLEPTLSALEKGDKRALLSRVDSEINITERELARQVTLGDLVPAKQVETTRIRLDQLRKERGQITGTALGRELLTAPVDGLVTDVHVVPGEVVASDRVLVEIVDPTRLRIEAVIHDLPVARRISGATAASKLVPDQSFPLTLLGRSPKVDPVDQGVHAIFQVAAGQAEALSIGMPVDVYLATGAVSLRTAVPRDSVAEVGGRQVVFVRTAPEVFEVRPVRVARVIGPLAEIAEGVAPGDRVVTQGIEQLKAGR